MSATIEEGLRSFLLTLDAVTALTTTIRPDELATGDTLPAITITVETEEPQNSLDGLGGLVNATITISSLSETKAEARAIAEAIRINGTNPGTGLAGYTGLAGTFTIDAYLIDRSSGYVAEEDGSDTGLYAVDSTYNIWFAETT